MLDSQEGGHYTRGRNAWQSCATKSRCAVISKKLINAKLILHFFQRPLVGARTGVKDKTSGAG